MPRQSRGPSRPVAAPSRPAPPSQPQARQASSVAYPPARTQQHPPTAQQARPQQQAGSQGPGLFGQMASTAAGVAVGSSIGHAIGGFFGGGSSSAQADQQQQQSLDQYAQTNASSQQASGGVCSIQVQDFKQCMDQNQGNLTICGWYLDQLKACQAAASQY